MLIKELHKIVDPKSLVVTIDPATAIVTYSFSINGGRCSAQSDPQNVGIYAFSFEGPGLLAALNLDDNGDQIKPEEVTEICVKCNGSNVTHDHDCDQGWCLDCDDWAFLEESQDSIDRTENAVMDAQERI